MEAAPPMLSIIIPARDASSTLDACLDETRRQAGENYEIIVVDDDSRDMTAAIAERHRVKLIRMPAHRGVAAARNAGARAARASILLFMDADVVPARALFAQGLAIMAESQVDALIGSYDDRPAADSLVSQFKNLAHHHFHQNSDGPATTFWGACGFVRRDVFLEAGGFDEERFVLPSIEDVELGDRLARRGARIRIAPKLQVTHLKRWTLGTLIHVDITRRAIPWTLLGLETGRLPRNLNFSWQQRLAAIVAIAEVVAIVALVFNFRAFSAWILLAALTGAATMLNVSLFRLFYEKGGVRLAICGFLLQQLYYLYSLYGFIAGVLIYLLRRSHVTSRSRSCS
jgi:GT2 family glycosyltransferase